jgi:hypothetical protein
MRARFYAGFLVESSKYPSIHNQALVKKLRARLQGQQIESASKAISQNDCSDAVSQVERFINKSMGIGIELPKYFVWTYP